MKESFEDRAKKIKSVSDDLEYLKGEYNQSVLYACRDGDVMFNDLMEWLSINSHNVEHMIKVARDIETLGGEL